MATSGQIDQLAAQVLARFDQGQTVDAMADDFVRLGINDAYRVQLALVAEVDGELVGSGAGVEVLGHPAAAVAWLANKLAEFELALRPGDIVLSGSIIRMLEVIEFCVSNGAMARACPLACILSPTGERAG